MFCFVFFPQITLADYSLSDATFDKLEDYKNAMARVAAFCNQTESLDAMIPQLEEFIDVARSELVCTPLKLPAAFMICAPLIQSANVRKGEGPLKIGVIRFLHHELR